MSSIAAITSDVANLAISPITPSLSSEPRKHFRPWLHAVNRYARSLFAQFDVYGLLFLVATDAIWNLLPHKAMLTGGFTPTPKLLPFCLPVVATRSIVISIGIFSPH
jgi:hypothetical protein